MAKRRSRILISDEVQTSLLFRVTMHWVAFVGLTSISLAAWICFIDYPVASGEELLTALLRVLVPFLVCSLVIVPVFLYDVARISNQFVGPIRRVRSTLKKYIDTNHFEPIRLRKGDYWQALAAEINAAIEQASQPAPAAKATAVTIPVSAAPQFVGLPTAIVADFHAAASTFAATSAR